MNIGGTVLHKTAGRLLSVFGCLLLIGLIVSPVAASAQSSGGIAQGYPADMSKGDIVAGSLVSLKSDSQSVELATINSAERMMGVVDQSPLIAISDSTTEVQVVSSGVTTALVSDINGEIRAGDRITISPIAGVGMKATTDGRVVGTAQSDFDVDKARAESVTDTNGEHHTVHIGYLPMQAGVTHYTAPSSTFLPSFVQSFANSVAGKEVSLVRITFCAILLLFSLISLGVLISSTVRSSISSLGRNPLAAPKIRKSLYQVGGIAVVILSGTLIACYVILVV